MTEYDNLDILRRGIVGYILALIYTVVYLNIIDNHYNRN